MCSLPIAMALFCAVGSPQGLAPPEPTAALPSDPPAALAALLDLRSPEARRTAADRLAARAEVSLDQWLAAARAVPLRTDSSEHLDSRLRRHSVPIWVMQTAVMAEILVRLPEASDHRGPLPLLFVGHETNRDARDAIATWAPLADRYGCLLASLTEPYEMYRTTGWAYEPDAKAAVFEALRTVRRCYDVDEECVVVAGVGRGGHMAWDVALHQPDQFAAMIAVNGSPRLGNASRENNLRMLEGMVPMCVRAVDCGAREALQTANQKRALQLLRSFGATDVRQVAGVDLPAVFASTDAAWDAVFKARRTVPKTLVRIPAIGWTPPPEQFGRRHWLDIVRLPPAAMVPWPGPTQLAAWGRLDAQGQRNAFDDFVRNRSQRMQITCTAPGMFTATSRDIDAIRLLLTKDMVAADGSVVVSWDGHLLRRTATPSAVVFLRDFAERFDRTFLPAIEIALP